MCRGLAVQFSSEFLWFMFSKPFFSWHLMAREKSLATDCLYKWLQELKPVKYNEGLDYSPAFGSAVDLALFWLCCSAMSGGSHLSSVGLEMWGGERISKCRCTLALHIHTKFKAGLLGAPQVQSSLCVFACGIPK